MNLLQKKYDRATFVNFLSDNFLPEDFRSRISEIELTRNQNFAVNAFRLGECKSLELEVFEVHHTSMKDARVGIAKDAFQLLLNHSYCNRALIAFVPSSGEQWRFSLIQIEAEINSKTNRIKRGYSNPRRFSFLLGKEALTKTPTQFLIEKGRVRQRTERNKSLTPWEDLLHRFSIEVLTQEFYEKLYNWYLWAIDKKTGVTFPNNTETVKDDRDDLEVKMIRLITRMLFVWFIKQKNLVPDNLFDIGFLSNILRDFKPNATDNGDYYNAILQNLFFATLNQERGKRGFVQPSYHGRSQSYGVKTLYRDNKKKSWFNFPEKDKEKRVIALFDEIPYLNGGLFECLDKFELDENDKLKATTFYDGFSTKDTRLHGNLQYRAFIPNRLFFASEHSETVTVQDTTETIEVMGLLELFKQYNFTVEENTSSDKEVSLDPELLGRVFENLLAAYNPETQESVRKSTGSFYTPREIVEFMVEEALVAYLSGDCDNDLSEIRPLVKNEDTPKVSNPQKIIADIKKIKILDPACGSGAFPMGILLKATDIIERLTPKDKFNRYETKLEIIKNCIYGVDIQAIAMLICKLRFFISLICDCEKDDSKENYGIIPLPNLETKFVAANTLLPAKVREFDNDWTLDERLQKLQKELLDLRLGIFDLRTHRDKLKNKISDRDKCKEIEDHIKKSAGSPDPKIIAREQKVISRCEEELLNYKGDLWVDETVQQSLFEENSPTIFRRNINKEKREELLSRIKIAKANIKKELEKSSLSGFEKAVEQVTHWDPYNQNSISPFFDSEWMFGLADGFDIVIGNPPYIQLQTNGGELAQIYEGCGYSTFARTGDIYCLFYERGWQLLKKDGHLCYITSNKWMRAGYGEKTRDFFVSKTNPMLLIDFAGVKIFESATVDTNILLFSKSDNKHKTICAVTNKQNKDSVKNLSDFVQQQYSECDFTKSDSWVILSPIEQSIKKKIESVGKPLKDWDINIYRGVLTGCNEAFIISSEKRVEILANCKTEKERSKTDDLIRPILRGRDVKRYGYDWANLYLIATFPARHYNIDNYPAVKEYLLSFAEDSLRDAGYDWVADRFLSDFCKQKLAQTGKIIEIDGKRITIGETPEKARKKTNNKWFETQDSISYWEDFSKPKVMWKIIGCNINFCFDDRQLICNNAVNIMVGDRDNLIQFVGLMNSKLFDWYLKLTTEAEVQGGGIQLYVTTLEKTLLKLDFPSTFTDIVYKRIKNQVTDDMLDKAVFEVYNLTPEEQAFILQDKRVNRN